MADEKENQGPGPEDTPQADKVDQADKPKKELLKDINIDSTNQYIRKISQIDHKISREESHEL